MGTILKNIVQFTGLTVGVPISRPHRLNVNNTPVAPKIGGADESGFDVTADTVNVTVTRTVEAAGGDVNVYVEYWHTMEAVTPLVPPPGKLIGQTPFFFASGGGGGAVAQLLSLYGDGSFGDHTTTGNDTFVSSATPPGAPTVPGGESPVYPVALYNNLTISPGDALTIGGLTTAPNDRALVIFVKGTLTIGAGSNINANGGNATDSGFAPGAVGRGRNAIIGSSDGADGAQGVIGNSGSSGFASGNQPASAWAAMNNTTPKGGSSTGIVNPGGPCGVSDSVSWPYSLSQAISIASLLYAIGGGNGGGSGGAATNGDISGSGGGGGGTLVIFAKKIVAPAGSIQARGGNGGAGFSSEPGVTQNAGGGMGGCGGTIIIVTEETTLAGICDVSGGVGGLPSEGGGNQGSTGNPGAIIAFNPMLAAQIPV